jgi:DNA polymerase-1
MSDKRLFLLDGHALVYRAHFSFGSKPLLNSKGMNTSAINGFTRTLWDLMQTQKPTHLAVAFDTSAPTFRHEMFDTYKANRQEQPEDIGIAIPYIIEILKAFKIPILTLDGYEADDVIGTLAKQAEAEGYTVYMVTPDKDFAQLVSQNIYLYKPSRMGNGIEILGETDILRDWEIQRIDQVIDILGLRGDSVDNIPGIPGVGPKTAVQLLEKFDTLEGVLENAHQLKGKQRENIEKFATQGLLSKQLATIDTKVPIQFDADIFVLEPLERERLAELFAELEFRSLHKAILGEPQEEIQPQVSTQGSLFDLEEIGATPALASIATKHIGNTAHQYHLVQDAKARQNLISLLSAVDSFCVDTETTSVDANEAELVGLAFAIRPGEAYYVPIPQNQQEAKAIVQEFKLVLENEQISKVGQNIKYDIIVLKWYDVAVKGQLFDTMLAHYLIEPELRHNLNYMAETYLQYQPVSIESLIGKKGKNQGNMRDVPVEDAKEYAGEDVDITLQLKNYFEPQLKQEKLETLFYTMEVPLVQVLADLEFAGVRVDTTFLANYSEVLTKDIYRLEQQIYEQAGKEFNIASPKQVGEILFDHLKIPYRWKKTASGQYATDEEKLTEYAKEFPIADSILQHRGLSKLKSTYVDALPQLVNPKTKRIHSSFNQALTATGRLSSNNPNLQNIPIRTAEGRKIREAFIPRDENHLILAADYSQIELRIVAEISQDKAMLEAFQAGYDIHRATASLVYEVPYDAVNADQRRAAKTINFAILYGAGAHNISKQLEIKRAEAGELIEQYFRKYSGLKQYMDNSVQMAREQGYVTTLLGRRRYLRDINSKNAVVRGHAERNAMNTPIQGTAADMIKLAMINVHKAFQHKGIQSKMILQVHDELVFDVLKSELEEVKSIVIQEMQQALPNLKVPIVVETGVGKHWLEAH